VNTGGRAPAEAHAPGRAGCVARRGVKRGRDAQVDTLNMGQQFRSGGRGRGPAPDALDEAHLEAPLKLAHSLADRGLREAQALGGAVKLPSSITSAKARS
jgi:hypothetical protein